MAPANVNLNFILLVYIGAWLGLCRSATENNFFTNENMVTYNGQVPQTTCPAGYYRPLGSTNLVMKTGQREDGCVPCPRGTYGSTPGLSLPTCTAPCPAGKYGWKFAQTTPNDCKFCPPGRYSSSAGLVDSCPGQCPAGTYSNKWGSITATDCKTCLPNYVGWQCSWAYLPRAGKATDHQYLQRVGRGVPKGYQDPYPIK